MELNLILGPDTLKEWNFKIWTGLFLLFDCVCVLETCFPAGTCPLAAVASPCSAISGFEFVALSNAVAFGYT